VTAVLAQLVIKPTRNVAVYFLSSVYLKRWRCVWVHKLMLTEVKEVMYFVSSNNIPDSLLLVTIVWTLIK